MHTEDKPNRSVEVKIARFPFSVRAEVELIPDQYFISMLASAHIQFQTMTNNKTITLTFKTMWMYIYEMNKKY